MARVDTGTARPTFPYSDYSQAELNKMYPQYINENVATTQTPEETHKLFVEKLKAGDLNGAVECCFKKADWNKIKDGLQKVKINKHWDSMMKDLETDFESNLVLDTKATYKYGGGLMSFIKDGQGVWLIESL